MICNVNKIVRRKKRTGWWPRNT